MGEVSESELVAGQELVLAQPLVVHIENARQPPLAPGDQIRVGIHHGRSKCKVEDEFPAWRMEVVFLQLQPLLDGGSLKDVSSQEITVPAVSILRRDVAA